MIVHKFGGSSLADAQGFKNVAEIINSGAKPYITVVSAMYGVTNQLQLSIHQAQDSNKDYLKTIETLKIKHYELLESLQLSELKSVVDEQLDKVSVALQGVFVTRACPEVTSDFIMGSGEILSAQVLASYLKTDFLDARELIFVDENKVLDTKNSEEAQKKFKSSQYIATGYIATSSYDMTMTTLGRNGSDYSAALIAQLFNADELIIWTDIDGVYNADPRIVPQAEVVPEMSYSEAMELAYFGAKVIHPKTMGPAIHSSIPLRIKDSFHPEKPGTLITNKASESKTIVKGFTLVSDIALINLEGSGLIGVPGISEKLFSCLSKERISVMAISQASSEHSICIAVQSSQAKKAQKAMEKAFHYELTHQLVQNVELLDGCCLLAAVGDKMAQTPGVASRLFSALAKVGVNIKAIAQGSSERNITLVIKKEQAEKAIKAAHAAFNLSDQTLSVGLIGPGLIGKQLLKQLSEQLESLKTKYNLDVRVRGILSSQKMLLSDDGLELNSWADQWESKAEASDINAFSKFIKSDYYPHHVIIDCTASDKISEHYPEWIDERLHIITPNKKAGSSDISHYKQIQQNLKQSQTQYLYETTVGAGLPIIKTLRDLIQTGDEVYKIEGVFSGTLSYIFNNFNSETSFSEIVKIAKQRGFTEPDPRDDLSGMDVARKVLILGREMGLEKNISDVSIENLVPKPLQAIESSDEFMQKLSDFDSEMEEKRKQAEEKGEVLRFVGSVDSQGNISAELKSYPKDHAFGGLSGTDNIISFTTKNYNSQPLIIRGPGAGPEVTAEGVFADLLRLAYNLGSRL